MKIVVSALAVLALGAAPAFALDNPGADHGSGPPTTSHAPATVPPSSPPGQSQSQGTAPSGNSQGQPSGNQPSDTPPAQAKALGKTECQQFKTDFGTNKSAFGKCISAVAQGLNSSSPSKATFEKTCRKAGLSRHRQKGKKHSPFTACVQAGAHALRNSSS
jgi:hypothetical protein